MLAITRYAMSFFFASLVRSPQKKTSGHRGTRSVLFAPRIRCHVAWPPAPRWVLRTVASILPRQWSGVAFISSRNRRATAEGERTPCSQCRSAETSTPRNLENKGCDRPKNASNGVPWYVILDAAGKPLITSNSKEVDEQYGSSNVGFPSSKAGIDHFMTMLRQTVPRLSGQALSPLRQKLEKKP